MSKKSDAFYFDNFANCAAHACTAARMLEDVLNHFDTAQLEQKLEELHQVEHNADTLKHEMMGELVKAFITPIERDDIIELSQKIDNVTDAVEDILIHIYITCTAHIRPSGLEFAALVLRCCENMHALLLEFKEFKKSKRLSQLIIELNRLEEDGDKLYVSSMHQLHATTNDVLEVIAWRQIYTYFEKACDACEDVADIVESIAIENV